MNKTNCGCASTTPNCNTEPTPCDNNQCQVTKNTLPLLIGLLSGNLTTILVKVDPDGVTGAWIQVNSSNIAPNETYYVYPNPIVPPNGTTDQSGTELDTTITLPFFLDPSLITNIIGNPAGQTLDQFLALVGYISDRIGCLCLPCCVKSKVIDSINNYIGNLLNANHNGTNPFTLRFANNPFSQFCGNERTYIPLSGPIYIANIITNPISNFSLVSCDNLNYVLEFLRFVQVKLRIAYSTRCCCNDEHDSGDCSITYPEVCDFVFGRLCVIDWPVTDCNNGGERCVNC